MLKNHDRFLRTTIIESCKITLRSWLRAIIQYNDTIIHTELVMESWRGVTCPFKGLYGHSILMSCKYSSKMRSLPSASQFTAWKLWSFIFIIYELNAFTVTGGLSLCHQWEFACYNLLVTFRRRPLFLKVDPAFSGSCSSSNISALSLLVFSFHCLYPCARKSTID